MLKFESSGPNEVLDCGEFYISYNPGLEIGLYDHILKELGRINPDNLGRPETALVHPDDNDRIVGKRFLILYGDYREAYAAIADQGLDACVALFEKHLEHIADTSDMPAHLTGGKLNA